MKETTQFRYETHLHTCQGSACGVSRGFEHARHYQEEGYAGIIITDHFFNGNTAVPRTLPWRKRVDWFCSGYEEAKEEGARLGLAVFFGWEACYRGTEFLIYGLDKNWLYAHPESETMSIPEQFRLVHEAGGMIIQAHPYREAGYLNQIRLFPYLADGVEVLNACNKDYMNVWAAHYAKKYHLPATAGSDRHTNHPNGGGMCFAHKLMGIEDYIEAVLAGEGELCPVDRSGILAEPLMGNPFHTPIQLYDEKGHKAHFGDII